MMREGIARNPTIDIPPWPAFDEHPPLTCGAGDSIIGEAMIAALQRYLPANDLPEAEEVDPALDAYSCDEFRIYEFKIRRCARGRPHDWTECPFAHPGEKARRRDPRKYHYSGAACPEFRKGSCKRGDACEFAHGVFECWLHPARYRTQPCKDGTACRRRVCFFAHTPRQLRVLPESYDGSPMRQRGMVSLSPPVSPPGDSPPMSPIGTPVRRGSWPSGSPVSEALLSSLRKMQLGEFKSVPLSWGGMPSPNGLGFGSGFYSLPSSPTTVPSGGAAMGLDGLEAAAESAAFERVESGRALRAKMYERLSKDAGPGRNGSGVSTGSGPDFGWVSELVK